MRQPSARYYGPSALSRVPIPFYYPKTKSRARNKIQHSATRCMALVLQISTLSAALEVRMLPQPTTASSLLRHALFLSPFSYAKALCFFRAQGSLVAKKSPRTDRNRGLPMCRRTGPNRSVVTAHAPHTISRARNKPKKTHAHVAMAGIMARLGCPASSPSLPLYLRWLQA